MQTVKERQRHASPATRPQPLAFHQGRLWMGSWDTEHLYAIDPQTWTVLEDVAAPGRPYGIAAFGGTLSVVVSVGEDDDRYLYRFDPGKGFDPASKTPCPDFTGSHLAADDSALYLCQQGNQRILVLDADAEVKREIALPTRCAGLGFGAAGESFIISGDEEFENLAMARFDLRADSPALDPVATIAFDARCLAFDGAAWWTSHREANEIVAFTI
jgi:sugar lactone lactonase YvrE